MTDRYVYVNNDNTISRISETQLPIEDFEEGAREFIVDHFIILTKLIDGYDINNLASKGVSFIDQGGGNFDLSFPVIDPPIILTLGEYLENVISKTNAMFSLTRQELADPNDAFEVAGYLIKQAVAPKILAGTATADEIALLQSEVDERNIDGETVNDLATKQVEKAQKLTKTLYIIDGIQKDIKDRLFVAASEQEADDIKDEAETRLDELKTAFYTDAL